MRALNCRDGNGNTLDRGLYIPTAREVVMEEKTLPAQVGMDTGVKYLFRC
jgi:hypothetical protein